jgi:SAM-dependent methyltransferase
MAEAGARVTGIDISPVAIDAARQEAVRRGVVDEISFEVMDAERLDARDGTFDVVCGTGILHHLDLERALKEVHRVLVPGGWAIFSEPLGVNPMLRLYRRLTPGMRTPDERPLKPRDLDAMRRRFSAVDAEFFNLVALAAIPLRRMPGGLRIARGLHRIDGWLFRRLPVTKSWAWIVVVRLRR